MSEEANHSALMINKFKFEVRNHSIPTLFLRIYQRIAEYTALPPCLCYKVSYRKPCPPCTFVASLFVLKGRDFQTEKCCYPNAAACGECVLCEKINFMMEIMIRPRAMECMKGCNVTEINRTASSYLISSDSG